MLIGEGIGVVAVGWILTGSRAFDFSSAAGPSVYMVNGRRASSMPLQIETQTYHAFLLGQIRVP